VTAGFTEELPTLAGLL